MAPTSTSIVFRDEDAPPRTRASNYPSPFAEQMAGRIKRPLGEVAGLTGFGVNLTELRPGAISALLHRHSIQDEFIYVLRGELVLVTGDAEHILTPGMCAAFRAGGVAHQLVNRSATVAVFLEVGDRREGDTVDYPADDLMAVREAEGWRFTHKDGRLYGDGAPAAPAGGRADR